MLPDLIEIIPPTAPIQARITVPGSKSLTNRALLLAVLAAGDVVLRGALWSEDTQVMTTALQTLGFEVVVDPDENEPCNRTIRVRGLGGKIPKGGTATRPLDLFVGNAGTAARFLSALVCLGNGYYRLHGTARMHERPQWPLFAALAELGYSIDSKKGFLPVTIHGLGPRHASCHIAVEGSSQFASALLLCAVVGGWRINVAGNGGKEAAYVAMTQRLAETFPHHGGQFQIEADASSASYFCAAGWLLRSQVEIAAFPKSDWQIDAAFPKFLPLPGQISRRHDLGDSIMTAAVVAPFADAPVQLTDLERLRVQECERVEALRTELRRCGAAVEENGQTLTISPGRGKLHGEEIETYNDHRMAMCFAIFGLKVAGTKLKNPVCVRKTFPNFFQKLAAAPPAGLGVAILNAGDGRRLGAEELFASPEAKNE